MAVKLPVVDFAVYNNVDERGFDDSINVEINKLSQEIYDAFTTVGFVYIKNHGIPDSEISRLFEVGKKFFKLPAEEKNNFARPSNEQNHGYIALGVENVDPSKSDDVKEAFNVTDPYNNALLWPEGDCSDFRPTVNSFFDICKKLTFKILDLISIGLKLEDRKLLERTHEMMGTPAENMTSLRLLYYPVTDLEEGKIRLGEHCDYGTLTLLFQDQIGGLEVLSAKEGFIPAPPVEGTILVNIGDLLQRWTNDELVSTKHRVVVPHEELLRLTPRQSVAFFVHPDNEVIVECLDGSGHYPAISSKDYLMQKFSATY